MRIGDLVVIGLVKGYEKYFNRVGTLEEYDGPSDFDFRIQLPNDDFHVYKHEISPYSKDCMVVNKIKALYAKHQFTKERNWYLS